MSPEIAQTEHKPTASPLISAIEPETLRRNVAHVLDTLNKNRYKDLDAARLIAVVKSVSPEVINQLKPLNILDIGENRAQVALPKLPLIAPEFRLHWIGRLQTNKVKYIIEHASMLHTLDRVALAQEAERRAAERGLTLPALVQVNIAREPQKGGMAVDEVRPFLRQMKDFPSLRVEGLMAIMPEGAPEDELRALFRGMRTLFEQLRDEAIAHVAMRELSMGMSQDYAIAASEGATMVRVGTALYGRQVQPDL